MKALPLRYLALSLALAFFAAGCGTASNNSANENDGDSGTLIQPDDLPPAPSDLVGSWKSACIKPENSQPIVLDFDFTPTVWALDYTVHGDADCQAPFMTIDLSGPYELGPLSSQVQGAREGSFTFAKRTVTPRVDAAVDFLTSSCGGSFAVDQPTAIDEGCAMLGMYPLETCPVDHDIVYLEGDVLTLGQRPADNNMCEPGLRPKALGVPLNRQ